MDSVRLARAIDRFVRCAFNEGVASYFMTYEQKSTLLTRDLYLRSGLFVVELMRTYQYGVRAEGIFVAETLLKHGKRVVIVSAAAVGRKLPFPIYWDVTSAESLQKKLLAIPGPGADVQEDIARLKRAFARYCRVPAHEEQVYKSSSSVTRRSMGVPVQ